MRVNYHTPTSPLPTLGALGRDPSDASYRLLLLSPASRIEFDTAASTQSFQAVKSANRRLQNLSTESEHASFDVSPSASGSSQVHLEPQIDSPTGPPKRRRVDPDIVLFADYGVEERQIRKASVHSQLWSAIRAGEERAEAAEACLREALAGKADKSELEGKADKSEIVELRELIDEAEGTQNVGKGLYELLQDRHFESEELQSPIPQIGYVRFVLVLIDTGLITVDIRKLLRPLPETSMIQLAVLDTLALWMDHFGPLAKFFLEVVTRDFAVRARCNLECHTAVTWDEFPSRFRSSYNHYWTDITISAIYDELAACKISYSGGRAGPAVQPRAGGTDASAV
ncbi:hypothetical protein JCM10450v2_003654 [Rhodotorula kratochvilovae]